MVTITWVNHASFVIKNGATALICDPWLAGPAFNNGWSLLSKTVFTGSEFSDISHIWFSHEHPDHFSPTSLKEIPETSRHNITALFQKTQDRNVIRFCRNMGFYTQELPNLKWLDLTPNFSILCGNFHKSRLVAAIDSWLLVKCERYVFLNLNDYIVQGDDELRRILRLAGKIDVLFTQFSYANFVGNPEDEDSHLRHAKEKIDSIHRQIAILQPKWVVPFASFVWFANTENFFMNKNANQVDTVYDSIKSTAATPIVLYPGDVWQVGTPHDSAPALGKYAEDYQSLKKRTPIFGVHSVAFDELFALGESFTDRVLRRNSKLLMLMLPKTRIYLTDHDRMLEFSYRSGLQEEGCAKDSCDIHMSSDSLAYCFKTNWGSGTLAVNGRYYTPRHGNRERFFRVFAPAGYNNAGIAVTLPVMFGAILRRFRTTLRDSITRIKRFATHPDTRVRYSRLLP